MLLRRWTLGLVLLAGCAAEAAPNVAKQEVVVTPPPARSASAKPVDGPASKASAKPEADPGDELRRTLLEQCQKDDASGCQQLGMLYLATRVEEDDTQRGAQFLERACQLDHSLCDRLAAEYASGNSLTRDPTKAEDLWEMACKAGNMAACDEVSNFLNGGAEPPPQPPRH